METWTLSCKVLRNKYLLVISMRFNKNLQCKYSFISLILQAYCVVYDFIFMFQPELCNNLFYGENFIAGWNYLTRRFVAIKCDLKPFQSHKWTCLLQTYDYIFVATVKILGDRIVLEIYSQRTFTTNNIIVSVIQTLSSTWRSSSYWSNSFSRSLSRSIS